MNISALKKHKNLASKAVKSRANSVKLHNVEYVSESQINFRYFGSNIEPYIIRIFFSGNMVDTSCTCPFTGGRICKHEVAALDYIIQNNDQISEENIAKISNEITIQLKKDHLLSKHVFGENIEDLESKFDVDSLSEVTSYKPNEILSITNFGRTNFKQSFKYDDETQELVITCNCPQPKPCFHIKISLLNIMELFTKYVFHPDYLDIIINDFSKTNNFSEKFDPHEYFDFIIDKNGISVESKFPDGIVNIEESKDFIPHLKYKDNQDKYLFDYQNEKKLFNNKGLGFCIEIEPESGGIDLFPFLGKLKKNSQEFTASFVRIFSEDFLEFRNEFSEQEQKILLDVFE
ncbi:MAG: SWIM zinc finger family protein, partial [Psychroflexus sp.]